MKLLIKQIISALIIGLMIFSLISIAFFLNFFKTWQNRLSDLLFLPHQQQVPLTIVAIDDDTIVNKQQWPIKRSTYAQLINKLINNHAQVIALDISFFEPSSNEEDKQLQQALQQYGYQIILAAEAKNLVLSDEDKLHAQLQAQSIITPYQNFIQNNQISFAFVNVIIDRDGISRSIPLSIQTNTDKINSFAYQTLSKYYSLTQNNIQLYQLDQNVNNNLPNLKINFIGPTASFPIISAHDLLNENFDPILIENRIILIGSTAFDLHDFYQTPVSAFAMSGVEVHANAIDTLYSQRFLNNEAVGITITTFFILAITLSVIFIFIGLKYLFIIGISTLIIYYFYAFISFDHGIIRHLIFPPLIIILTMIGNLIYKYFNESNQRRFIKKAMSFYLSNEVMKDILKDPSKFKFGGQRKKMTVLFADIANFTSIAERLDVDTLTQLLNDYLTEITKIIFKYNGVLDKFIGDAVMAFWGAPIRNNNQALHACQTAIEIQEITQKKQALWQKYGINNLHTRIGINSGEMAVGNLGSNLRFDYTVLGDHVNLGARLESLGKQYSVSIIISDHTYQQVKRQVIARKLDRVTVKGKSKGITIYELIGIGRANTQQQDLITNFEQALTLYQEAKFKSALALFTEISKKYHQDGPSKIFIKRCQELIKKPPKNWDAIYQAKNK